MTEAEWLACESPSNLAAFARGKVEAARFRWLAVEWGARVKRLMDWDDERPFELFAAEVTGVEPPPVVELNYDFTPMYFGDMARPPRFDWPRRCIAAIRAGDFALAAACAAESAIADAVHSVAVRAPTAIDPTKMHRGRSAANRRATEAALLAARQAHESAVGAAEADARREIGRVYAEQFRDVAGDPFRPAALDPAWLSADVVGLARAAFASADFSLLPILADALEESGCDSAELLDHLRGGGVHVRGCWALEWARVARDSA